jgi:drug/metabolite transporter (DMT)-like permease
MPQRKAIVPYVWMIQASVVFTAMLAMARTLGGWCDWQVVAIVRASMVLVLVAGVSFFQGKRVFIIGPPTLWIRGVAGSLSMVCTFFAITQLQISDTLTLTNMYPIWIAFLSWPILGERPSLQIWIAVSSSCAGVWLIQQPHFGTSNLGIAAAFAASLFTAVAMLGLHRLRGLDPQTIVVHFSAVATCFCVASYFVFSTPPPTSEAAMPLSLSLLCGVGVTASVGQILLTRAFAAGNPARVGVVGLTQIVFGLIVDILFFDHVPTWVSLLGIVLIALPTAWVMLSRSEGHSPPGPEGPGSVQKPPEASFCT